MNSSKKFIIQSVIVIMSVLLILGSITIYIDPYFHYHSPLKEFEYPIDNERYQNDGISRFWDYDAIITGSSMTECFKTSEFDELFGAQSIKIPCSGGKFKEIDEALQRAIQRNPSIKYIVRSLDFNYMILDIDAENDEALPDYLYDENIFNDASYIFNKEILFGDVIEVLDYTKSGQRTTSLDEYMSWPAEWESGKDAILKHYGRPDMAENIRVFDEETKQTLRENIEQNVLQTVKENPDIQFYFFFPPYGIYWWDMTYRNGNLERHLDVEKYVIEMLLQYDNVHLYSFFDNFDLICNTDLYIEHEHYNETVNSQILIWMKNEEHKLTCENYNEYCEQVRDFYMNFDYDSLFVEE